MRSTWNFSSANQLTFGAGAIQAVGPLLARRGWKRVLIATDKRLVAAGIVESLLKSLRSEGVEFSVFDEGEPEPSVVAAEKAIAAGKAFSPAAVIGLGGGSNMDLAKIVAVVLQHGGAASGYFGFDNVPAPVLPLLCVPTTAGTGSEVSHAAVLTDTANQIKVSTLSPYLRPSYAVVDPELTYSCPRQVTADSGIDALTHAIEGYTAVNYTALEVPPGQALAYEGATPVASLFAEKAIALIGRHLVAAVTEPNNREARDAMALAATLAGLAFSNAAVALVHALEYPLGGVLHCSHGAGNGLLLPYVMRYNLPARMSEFARIAELLGEPTAGLSEQAAAEQAIVAVDRLRSAIGIPQRIRDLGGKREQLPSFASKAFAIKRLMLVNPRQPSEADLLGILQEAF